MPKPRDARSIIEAAEQAAATGNYGEAVTLLREAAFLQQAALTPLYLELANTLNNLGVMCERNNNPVEAEHNFRRAVSFTAAAAPDHPFASTSRENLREFCEAQGKPVESPKPSPAVAAKPESQPGALLNAVRAVKAATVITNRYLGRRKLWPKSAALLPLMPQGSERPLAVAGSVAVVVLLLIAILAGHQRLRVTGTESLSAVALDPTPKVPTMREPSSAEPITGPTETTTTVASVGGGRSNIALDPPKVPTMREPSSAKPTTGPTETTKTVASVGAGRSSRITADSKSVRPTVVRARLCAELDQWLCDPADRPVPRGPLFFYTQVKSPSATTVEHRWYRGDRLEKTEELRIQVRPAGDRTYSRHILDRKSAGSWKVEVRAKDGGLLHEERFSVR